MQMAKTTKQNVCIARSTFVLTFQRQLLTPRTCLRAKLVGICTSIKCRQSGMVQTRSRHSYDLMFSLLFSRSRSCLPLVQFFKSISAKWQICAGDYLEKDVLEEAHSVAKAAAIEEFHSIATFGDDACIKQYESKAIEGTLDRFIELLSCWLRGGQEVMLHARCPDWTHFAVYY